MIKVNVAKRYSDLNSKLINQGLIENNRSPRDVKDYFDSLLECEKDIEIVTLHDEIINIISIYIYENKLKTSDIEVNIYENGAFKQKVLFKEEGYLDENWEFGLLSFGDWD